MSSAASLHRHVGVDGDELVRDDVADRTVQLAVLGHRADDDVAVGDDADRLPVVHDRHDAGVFVAHDARGVLDAVLGRDGARIGRHHVADIHGLLRVRERQSRFERPRPRCEARKRTFDLSKSAGPVRTGEARAV